MEENTNNVTHLPRRFQLSRNARIAIGAASGLLLVGGIATIIQGLKESQDDSVEIEVHEDGSFTVSEAS